MLRAQQAPRVRRVLLAPRARSVRKAFPDRVAVAKALYADAHFVDLSPIERAALTDAIGVVEKLLAREVAE